MGEGGGGGGRERGWHVRLFRTLFRFCFCLADLERSPITVCVFISSVDFIGMNWWGLDARFDKLETRVIGLLISVGKGEQTKHNRDTFFFLWMDADLFL